MLDYRHRRRSDWDMCFDLAQVCTWGLIFIIPLTGLLFALIMACIPSLAISIGLNIGFISPNSYTLQTYLYGEALNFAGVGIGFAIFGTLSALIVSPVITTVLTVFFLLLRLLLGIGIPKNVARSSLN